MSQFPIIIEKGVIFNAWSCVKSYYFLKKMLVRNIFVFG